MDASEKIHIWEKIIDVQQHFNNVKSKNQTLFISIITASLAGAGYLSQSKETNPLLLCHALSLKIYTLPILGAFIFTVAFYILDVGIYHNLLKGSVECGKKFEKEELNQELTSIIIERHSKDDKTFGFIQGAECKLKAFYFIIGFTLLAAFLFLNL